MADAPEDRDQLILMTENGRVRQLSGRDNT